MRSLLYAWRCEGSHILAGIVAFCSANVALESVARQSLASYEPIPTSLRSSTPPASGGISYGALLSRERKATINASVRSSMPSEIPIESD